MALCWSQWPHDPRYGSAATRLLGLWGRISQGACMFVSCECCVFSGRGLCIRLITCPEQSYQVWCVQWVWLWSPKGEVMAPNRIKVPQEKKMVVISKQWTAEDVKGSSCVPLWGRHCSFPCLVRVRNTTRNLNQDCLCRGMDSNCAPPEYEAGMLLLMPTWLGQKPGCLLIDLKKWATTVHVDIAITANSL